MRSTSIVLPLQVTLARSPARRWRSSPRSLLIRVVSRRTLTLSSASGLVPLGRLGFNRDSSAVGTPPKILALMFMQYSVNHAGAELCASLGYGIVHACRALKNLAPVMGR